MPKTADDIEALFAQAMRHALDYRETIGERPQRPAAGYGAMRSVFAAPTPETGTQGEAIIDDLVHKATPGLHAHIGPRFFGWVIGGSHPVGVAADWLVSAWGQNCGNHHIAPAMAAIEENAANWLVDILDLPRSASVGFVTGATGANFVGLAAARGEVLRRHGWDVERDGLIGAPPIEVLVGDEAHFTVSHALQMLGLGHGRARRIATDGMGRIRPEAFEEALSKCEGPVIAVLQAGQINTGAFDDFTTLIGMAHERGAWVHVDGAFGLWARACPEKVHLTEGIEQADSWTTDGHKWLQTPYECGFAIVRDGQAHRRAMSAAAAYIPAEAEDERNPGHLVPELSRRGRGMPVFAMIRHFGRHGIAELVARHCALARHLAECLRESDGIEIVNTVELNQLIVRFGAHLPVEEGDRLTQEVIEAVQEEGECFVAGAPWHGRFVMRFSVSNWATTQEDVDRAASAILRAWDACRPGS